MDKNTKPKDQAQGAQAGGGSPLAPLNAQLDPGLKWRLYWIEWTANRTTFTKIVATNTAHGSYQAGKEYWYVDKDALSGGDSLTVGWQNKEWSDATPSQYSNGQQFQAPTTGDWQPVSTSNDTAVGTLYKHETADYYVRIGIQGTGSNKTLSVVRWYRKESPATASRFEPSGSFVQADDLGSGTTWYADSLPPPPLIASRVGPQR